MEHRVDSTVYSKRVLELFDAPPNAGPPSGANRTGEAVSKPRGSRVRLHLKMAGGTVTTAGFEALGCPHTIAGAALVAGDLVGRRLADLSDYGAGFLETELPLPAEKRDIRILIEDAVRDAARPEATAEWQSR